jgi:hypothetical protein
MGKKNDVTEAVRIPAIEKQHIVMELVGDSPLICHRWSAKAKKEMRDKQQKKAKQAREAKDPQQEYEESLYRLPDGKYGFPAVAFKAAAVSAAKDVGLEMTAMRRAFHIPGELVEIEGEPEMREDPVRLMGKTADLRYRGAFPQWRARLHITFNSRVITGEQLANLFNTAGFAVGVGEWRPQRDGSFGMFHVATEEDCR